MRLRTGAGALTLIPAYLPSFRFLLCMASRGVFQITRPVLVHICLSRECVCVRVPFQTCVSPNTANSEPFGRSVWRVHMLPPFSTPASSLTTTSLECMRWRAS